MSKNRIFFKCTNPFCPLITWTVWYPYEIPEDPTCSECNIKYIESYNDEQ